MCRNGTTSIDDVYLELDAFGPPRSPLTANTSITCSCYINTTHSYLYRPTYGVAVQFSRYSNSVSGCMRNEFDEATLILRSGSINRSTTLTLQNNNLFSYYGKYQDISAITFSMTINSICGSNYTIQLKQSEYSTIQNKKFYLKYVSTIQYIGLRMRAVVSINIRFFGWVL